MDRKIEEQPFGEPRLLAMSCNRAHEEHSAPATKLLGHVF